MWEMLSLYSVPIIESSRQDREDSGSLCWTIEKTVVSVVSVRDILIQAPLHGEEFVKAEKATCFFLHEEGTERD